MAMDKNLVIVIAVIIAILIFAGAYVQKHTPFEPFTSLGACTPGDCYALSASSHATCLSSGRYSGQLSGACPTTTSSPCNSVANNRNSACTCPSGEVQEAYKDSSSQTFWYYNCIPSSSACTESWTCGSWSVCSNGIKVRNCNDVNGCGSTVSKPVTSQSCTTPTTCTPDWNTGDWGSCSSGTQTRTVTDNNNCGITTNKPVTSQSCTTPTTCTPNWQTGSWGACEDGQQTRDVEDLNNCDTSSGQPSDTRGCSSVNGVTNGVTNGSSFNLNDEVFKIGNFSVTWIILIFGAIVIIIGLSVLNKK